MYFIADIYIRYKDTYFLAFSDELERLLLFH